MAIHFGKAGGSGADRLLFVQWIHTRIQHSTSPGLKDFARVWVLRYEDLKSRRVVSFPEASSPFVVTNFTDTLSLELLAS